MVWVDEAAWATNFGTIATEGKFVALYTGILTTWFPIEKGYMINHEVSGGAGEPRSRYIIICYPGAYTDPLLIVELTRPSNWTDRGKWEVLCKLTAYIEARFGLTLHNTIYGLGGIGLHWMVCKMEKSGGAHVPSTVLDWHDDISSDQSYDAFKNIAELVYNIQ